MGGLANLGSSTDSGRRGAACPPALMGDHVRGASWPEAPW